MTHHDILELDCVLISKAVLSVCRYRPVRRTGTTGTSHGNTGTMVHPCTCSVYCTVGYIEQIWSV